jgi:hypothetical protein
LQLDQRHGVGRGVFIAGRGIAQDRVRINFTLAAEGILLFGFAAAVWADITRRENLSLAVRADFTY